MYEANLLYLGCIETIPITDHRYGALGLHLSVKNRD